MSKVPKVIKIISTLGILPFLFGAIASLQLSLIQDYLNKFFLSLSILYAALILSFLGGCLFGFECLNKSIPNIKRAWIAIVPTIWALLAMQIPEIIPYDDIQTRLLVEQVQKKFKQVSG